MMCMGLTIFRTLEKATTIHGNLLPLNHPETILRVDNNSITI